MGCSNSSSVKVEEPTNEKSKVESKENTVERIEESFFIHTQPIEEEIEGEGEIDQKSIKVNSKGLRIGYTDFEDSKYLEINKQVKEYVISLNSNENSYTLPSLSETLKRDLSIAKVKNEEEKDNEKENLHLQEYEKIRRLYIWIKYYISFNMKYDPKNPQNKPEEIIDKNVRKTTGYGFTKLFSALAKLMGLKSFIVQGMLKSGSFHPILKTVQKYTWNCIALSGEYYYLDIGTDTLATKQDVDLDFQFLPNPDRYVKQCFPDFPHHLLLPKTKDFNFEELKKNWYEENHFSITYHTNKFKFDNEKSVIRKVYQDFNLKLKCNDNNNNNDNKTYKFYVKCEKYQEKKEPEPKTKKEVLNQHFYNPCTKEYEFKLFFPEPGTYCLNISVLISSDELGSEEDINKKWEFLGRYYLVCDQENFDMNRHEKNLLDLSKQRNLGYYYGIFPNYQCRSDYSIHQASKLMIYPSDYSENNNNDNDSLMFDKQDDNNDDLVKKKKYKFKIFYNNRNEKFDSCYVINNSQWVKCEILEDIISSTSTGPELILDPMEEDDGDDVFGSINNNNNSSVINNNEEEEKKNNNESWYQACFENLQLGRILGRLISKDKKMFYLYSWMYSQDILNHKRGEKKEEEEEENENIKDSELYKKYFKTDKCDVHLYAILNNCKITNPPYVITSASNSSSSSSSNFEEEEIEEENDEKVRISVSLEDHLVLSSHFGRIEGGNENDQKIQQQDSIEVIKDDLKDGLYHIDLFLKDKDLERILFIMVKKFDEDNWNVAFTYHVCFNYYV